ncbi:pyridine nucleotide-disulfide oxidoreductase-like protein 6 [Elsinoe australis]|uniref:Pyridine nucleotide-disulfide oxidoreductase-like protein 6 n=1 Tax=Elsinoe australis TaxID=40998 RepID=A0A4U7ARV5_9PEZI|nr:pyridine nucleotide-disulfide oxidoreductase-like protein 6 [Elsinoe australis]
MPQTQVLIIGGSYTGTGVAHHILKNNSNVKVTLVNTSTHYFFNIASPRIVAKPKEVPLDKVLISIPEHFKQYPSSAFEFVHGTVTSLDISSRTARIDGEREIKYDYVVIASGSTTPSTIGKESIPFKATEQDDLRDRLRDAQDRIAKSKSIIIAGAGPVGVETAGEIAEAYPGTTVTLISSRGQVLPDLKPAAASKASSNLQNLGVKIVLSTKVTSSQLDERTGKWTVSLDNGKVLDADLFISAAGNIANTSFLKPDYLDQEGWVKVDDNLRVQGVKDGSAFALGDVTTFKQRYLLKAQDQIAIVAGNVAASIGKGALKTYNASDKLMVFVPIGSKSGTGQVGGWVVWSFMVAFAKGRDYFVPKAASYISAK